MRAVVDPRLRQSLHDISLAQYSDAERIDRFFQEAMLPTNMGGVSVGGAERRSSPIYAAAVLRRAPTLARTCSLLAGKSPEAVVQLPQFKEALNGYEAIRKLRDDVGKRYDALDKCVDHTTRGGKRSAYHPRGLPTALPTVSDMYDPKSKSRIPSTRALTGVVMHDHWLGRLAACKRWDEQHPHKIKHRETTRFISVSQFGASAPFEISPDGSFATQIPSRDLETIMQRHFGLNISAAESLCAEYERTGAPEGRGVDRLGDKIVNKGEHTRRHNAVLRRTATMVSAVASNEVIKGDKENLAATEMLNEDHVVDIAELEGHEATGADVLYEVKVPSSLIEQHSKGNKNKKGGASIPTLGHVYAFGSTEEVYRVQIMGRRRRGRKRDGPLDRSTGRGYVDPVKGDYNDAIEVKRSHVVPVIVESTGGLTPHLLAHIGHLARRARGEKGAKTQGRDRTVYGKSRTSARSFFIHHTQRIALAAVLFDARALRRAVQDRRSALMAAARPEGADRTSGGSGLAAA